MTIEMTWLEQPNGYVHLSEARGHGVRLTEHRTVEPDARWTLIIVSPVPSRRRILECWLAAPDLSTAKIQAEEIVTAALEWRSMPSSTLRLADLERRVAELESKSKEET